jgi:sugar lactone lactonase YvrE
MTRIWAAGVALAAAGTAVWLGGGTAAGEVRPPVAPKDATWTTVFASPLAIEGLTTGPDGGLYVAQRAPAGSDCPVVRVDPAGGARQQGTVVATVPAPCNPAGLTFGPDGRVYVTGSGAAGDQIAAVAPDRSGPATPPAATIFATGTPGANGLVFDRAGNLYTTDGGTNQGRVFRVGPSGGAAAEIFRVPPMANAAGVGRTNQSLQPPATGLPPAAQGIVANGIVVTGQRTLVVADTARGALWQVPLSRGGRVLARTGCDTTFTADTLCLDALLVEHPALEGADGITLDRRGNVWADANERNAIVVADRRGRVSEFFRNPVAPDTGLRNAGPLEFPTSPVLAGRTLCTTSSDGNRRDNAPSSAGVAAPGSAVLGTISCLDQRVGERGLN